MDDKTIVSLLPVVGRRSEIVGGGPHMASLSGDSGTAGAQASTGSGATARAGRATASRRKRPTTRGAALRPRIGAGCPLFGIQQATATAAPTKPGRFLPLFASDTPIEHRHVTDLVATSADIAATVRLIGEKLFGMRGALWSASHLPW